MFDEHFERSVGEILYGASLLQLGEGVQKTFRAATPVTDFLIHTGFLLKSFPAVVIKLRVWP